MSATVTPTPAARAHPTPRPVETPPTSGTSLDSGPSRPQQSKRTHHGHKPHEPPLAARPAPEQSKRTYQRHLSRKALQASRSLLVSHPTDRNAPTTSTGLTSAPFTAHLASERPRKPRHRHEPHLQTPRSRPVSHPTAEPPTTGASPTSALFAAHLMPDRSKRTHHRREPYQRPVRGPPHARPIETHPPQARALRAPCSRPVSRPSGRSACDEVASLDRSDARQRGPRTRGPRAAKITAPAAPAAINSAVPRDRRRRCADVRRRRASGRRRSAGWPGTGSSGPAAGRRRCRCRSGWSSRNRSTRY